MTAAQLLAVMLALGAVRDRAAPIADAIAHAAPNDARGAAVLVALAWQETSFGRAGPPFGVLAALARGRGEDPTDRPLAYWAARSLAIWRRGRAQCRSDRDAWFYYNAGRCPQRVRGHSAAFRHAGRVATDYADQLERVVARVRTRLAAQP